MAKRNTAKIVDELRQEYQPMESVDAEEVIVAPVSDANYNYPRTILRSMVEARIVLPGVVSGANYEWPQAGSKVSVDSRDAPALLAKRIGVRGCCGQNENLVFEIV